MTARALIEQFAPLVREDIDKKEYSRADFAVGDLDRAVEKAAWELESYLRDPGLAPVARRYRTPGTVSASPLEIVGTNFIGDRR